MQIRTFEPRSVAITTVNCNGIRSDLIRSVAKTIGIIICTKHIFKQNLIKIRYHNHTHMRNFMKIGQSARPVAC